MSAHDIDDDYLAKLAADKKKKTLYAVVGAVLVIGLLVWGYSTMFSDADGVVEFMNAGPEAPEQAVIEPLPPPERRSLEVNSEPEGASIIVNGIPAQRLTPATVEVVANARNTISLYRDGYRTVHATVDADQTELQVALTPWVAPPRPDDYVPPTDEAGNALPEDPVHGRVRVVTRSTSERMDGATIWHNGQLVAEPSPTTLRVQTGEEQHILVRRAGYLDAIAFVRAIPYSRETDERELLLEMQVDRDNAFSALTLRTFPQDAKVWLDDQEITGNAVTPIARNRHFVLRAEAPGHDSWEQAFEASVGSIELSVQLQRPIAELGTLTIVGLPEDADAFIIPQREGAEGGTQIGRRGQVELRELESGAYTLRIGWGPHNQRKRKDFDIEVVAGEHRHITLSGTAEAIEIASTTNRRPRK